ncbi:MAG: DUF222 domain-containing protein [Actinobacteria bacterium]|nr:DUF222 domain-containing protein [Actinomycetota bacterium]
MFESSIAPDLDCEVDFAVDGVGACDAFRDMAMWDDELVESEPWDVGLIEAYPVRELLDHLLTLTPDGFVMSALAGVDTRRLSDVDAVTFLQLHQRVASWWASLQARAVVAAASAEPLIEEFTLLVPDSEEERTIRIADARREELAAALRLPPATSQRLIDTSRLLAAPLADTASALAAGEITDRHVAVLVEAAERLPGRHQHTVEEIATFRAACAELQRRVLPTARRATVAMTRAAGKRAVLAIDADGERRRRRNATCTRDVWVSEDVDGLSLLIARLSTEHAHALLAEVNAHAHAEQAVPGQPTVDRSGDAPLTIGERRAQALVAAVLASTQDGPHPSLRAHVDFVIDLPTALRLAEGNDDSAELRGAGPIPAEVIRDLFADPDVAVTMRRLVTDPVTGHLLDYGRRTYAVPQRLRDFIVARDRVCRFPGCRRAAARSQLDHAEAWNDGGATSPANLGALCVRHHQLKTHGGWDLTDSRPDGGCTWTSPDGRQYDHDPPPF